MKHVPIALRQEACNCPLCGVYAAQSWNPIFFNSYSVEYSYISKCQHCSKNTYWLQGRMIYPTSGSAPLPNNDLPNDLLEDYEEARSIVELSPRGAVALLRLCVQKLCKELGEKGENINTDIKNLVSKGLPLRMQQALDSVRVIGNNAVHPGQIDLTDDRETAYKLFGFINIITDILITQPKQIEDFYNIQLPESDKAAIAKRDNR